MGNVFFRQPLQGLIFCPSSDTAYLDRAFTEMRDSRRVDYTIGTCGIGMDNFTYTNHLRWRRVYFIAPQLTSLFVPKNLRVAGLALNTQCFSASDVLICVVGVSGDEEEQEKARLELHSIFTVEGIAWHAKRHVRVALLAHLLDEDMPRPPFTSSFVHSLFELDKLAIQMDVHLFDSASGSGVREALHAIV